MADLIEAKQPYECKDGCHMWYLLNTKNGDPYNKKKFIHTQQDDNNILFRGLNNVLTKKRWFWVIFSFE